MKYCTRCKRIFFNAEKESCPLCQRKITENPNHYSPVYAVTANGFELERIRSVLDSEGISYSFNEARHDAGIQILNSAPPENCDIYIPLCEYEKAIELLKGAGAVSEEEAPEPDESSKEQLQQASRKAADEHMDPKKARTVRIFSAIAFLLLLVGAVYLTDFIIALIKTALGF